MSDAQPIAPVCLNCDHGLVPVSMPMSRIDPNNGEMLKDGWQVWSCINQVCKWRGVAIIRLIEGKKAGIVKP